LKNYRVKLKLFKTLRRQQEEEVSSKPLEVDIKVIKTPTGSVEKEIYLAFLKRAMILTEDQIHRIQERMSRNDLDFSERSIYPEGNDTSVEDKVTFVLKTHPELATPLKIAGKLDAGETTRRTVLTLNFIENILYNKTLGNNIYSFVDLQWHLAQGELSDLRVIEFKFLREINDA